MLGTWYDVLCRLEQERLPRRQKNAKTGTIFSAQNHVLKKPLETRHKTTDALSRLIRPLKTE